MRLNLRKSLILVGLLLVTTGAFQNCSSFQSIFANESALGAGGPNSVTLNVDGCGNNSTNEPCVTVTICTPGTSECVTVDNIIFDTGSTGLRIFKTLLNGVTFSQIPGSGSGSSLAECYEYGDGSYGFWGPLQYADVQLGGETAHSVPIQIVDQTFSSKPSTCQLGVMASPATAGVNGIMGVMSFVQDCGSDCTTGTSVGLYYSCTSTGCSQTTVPLANQATNPIWLMPVDNNGFIIQLPNVPISGNLATYGQITLGIGTQSNNMPSPSAIVPLNASADDTFAGSGFFGTTFNNVSYASSAFLDTGTPMYNMQSMTTTLPDCTASDLSTFLCPTSTQNLTAEMQSGVDANVTAVSFQVSDPTPFLTMNAVPNVAVDNGDSGNVEGGLFVWGLPFFFGRTVYIGLEGKTSPIGSDQYFAF